MVDHYRGLIKSLMKLGFLFKRQGERKHEIWRNRLTEQHVTFDRQAVSSSRAAVAAVLKDAGKPVEKPAAGRAARSKAKRRTRRIARSPAKAKSAPKPPVKKPSVKKPSVKKASKGKASKGKAKASRPARRRTR